MFRNHPESVFGGYIMVFECRVSRKTKNKFQLSLVQRESMSKLLLQLKLHDSPAEYDFVFVICPVIFLCLLLILFLDCFINLIEPNELRDKIK